METKDLLTIKEASQRLGVTLTTTYQAIGEGRLPCVTVLGRKAVRLQDVEDYRNRVGEKPRGRPKGSFGRKRKERESGIA